MTFSLIEEEDEDKIERMDFFKYLGRPMDWSDDNWPSVR